MNGKRTIAPPERTVLYRIRDEAGVLLYIGISCNFPQRWNHHMMIQPWWDELHSLTFEWYKTRALAEVAEKDAILAELPKYNRTYLMPRRAKALEPTPESVSKPAAKLRIQPLLTETGVADYLGVSVTDVVAWRKEDTGPSYFILPGKCVRYHLEDVEEWQEYWEAGLPSGGGGQAGKATAA